MMHASQKTPASLRDLDSLAEKPHYVVPYQLLLLCPFLLYYRLHSLRFLSLSATGVLKPAWAAALRSGALAPLAPSSESEAGAPGLPSSKQHLMHFWFLHGLSAMST